ncbi:MAG: hypothetical protein D3910_21630 [Candidatus Electrothrix sp. ATG2]|nr:hypothetical protein [Candidatus Electrothrix sp. ATG2]
MLKNKSFSADERLSFKARKKAQSEHCTDSNIDKEYSRLMEQLSYARPSRRYSRDELNER